MKDNMKKQFDLKEDSYRRLGSNLQDSLKYLLINQDIPFLDVQHRVKDLSSFLDKIDRKNYKNPFQEMEDICGLRIICYYPSDINRIVSIIKDEFYIVESQDKIELLEPDKFGYRSFHFVIKVKEEWLNVPSFRELGDLKAEIQIRTILMHAWADISHKLSYKKKEHIPEHFQRKLFQLSALFEIADDRFELLREEKEKYIHNLVIESSGTRQFDISQDLNLDSLQAFLDFYFPNKEADVESTLALIDEMNRSNINIEKLYNSYIKVKDYLCEFEQESYGIVFEDEDEEIFKNAGDRKWKQVGVARYILDLTSENYFKKREHAFTNKEKQLRKKHKSKISKRD